MGYKMREKSAKPITINNTLAEQLPKMKTCVILVLLVITVSAAEWNLQTKEEHDVMVANCDRQFPDRFEVEFSAQRVKGIPIEAIPYILCRIKGFGVWSDSEGFLVDRIMIAFDLQNKEQKVDREKFRKDLESCQDKNSQRSSPTEFAHRIMNCFFANQEFWKIMKHIRMYIPNEEKH